MNSELLASCFRTEEQVVTSLLDTDAYKFFMQQAVFHHYSNTSVVAEFRCRDQEPLGYLVDAVQAQVQALRQIQLSDAELNYLAQSGLFQADYLNYLKDFRLDRAEVLIENNQGRLEIQIQGNWLEVILWEIPILAIVSELHNQQRYQALDLSKAQSNFAEYLEQWKAGLTESEKEGFRLLEFGTRRRFSKGFHQFALHQLNESFGSMLAGSSNVAFSMAMGRSPLGTQAHEWFQAHQQLTPQLENSQKLALQCWLKEYPEQLGIALTDCISMDAFLRDFTVDLAMRYQGLRHDSGDPIQWGERALAHYEHLGIDPTNKILVFSDGLNLDSALRIYRHFAGRVKMSFGIGTQLTCRLPDVKPLNIVLKLVQCNGGSVAKLSDSPGKTMSRDTQFIEKLRQAYGLEATFS